ncbi:MAG: hypothetical protein R2881_02240 [Eubacteriales bacterium]
MELLFQLRLAGNGDATDYLIGVLGTYLTMQLGKTPISKISTTRRRSLIRAAKITVGELQQTMASQLTPLTATESSPCRRLRPCAQNCSIRR